MTRIVLATRNPGKLTEFRRMLEPLGYSVEDLSAHPEVGPIAETGESFEENARIKAETVARITGLTALADDSGIEADALDGRPGVYSARFAGPEASDAENNAKLVRELAAVPEERRTVRYRCAIALAGPEGTRELTAGSVEGRLVLEPRGDGGFGYDPYFAVPELGRTMAELTAREKDRISHRGKALEALVARLEEKGSTDGA